MDIFLFGVDIWEGDATSTNFNILQQNGVGFASIRLNSMSGGHHMDDAFVATWERIKQTSLLRFPYFVYNPWVTGQANYDWLIPNVPADVKMMAIDIEVKKAGYSPDTYAREVETFMKLSTQRWKCIIYTGEWFRPYLSYWQSCDYWIAQYPYDYWYEGQTSTWQIAGEEAKKLTFPPSAGKNFPGATKLWQVSGDKLILQGSPKPIDVNIWNGTYEQMKAWIAGAPTPPTPVLTDKQKLDILWAEYLKTHPVSVVPN